MFPRPGNTEKRPKDGSTIKELMMMTQQVLQGEVISLRPRPNSPTSCRVYTRHAAGSTHDKLPGLHTTSCCWRRALVTLALQTSWQGVGHQADKVLQPTALHTRPTTVVLELSVSTVPPPTPCSAI